MAPEKPYRNTLNKAIVSFTEMTVFLGLSYDLRPNNMPSEY